MSSPVLPCDACGSPIQDADLETGRAVTLMGKRYCPDCKSEAISGVSLDDLSGTPGPAPVAAPARRSPPAVPTQTARPAAPAPAKSSGKLPHKSAVRRAAAAPAPPAATSRMPLILSAAGLVVILAVGGVLLASRGTPAPEFGTKTPVAPVTGPATNPPVNSEAQAREAYTRAEELAKRDGVSWDLVLAAADKARPICRGTLFEKKLEELRTRVLRERDLEASSRELSPLIDELKGAAATDPEFKRYSELQPKFQLAIETGARSGSPRVAEIRALQNDYNQRYEKLAEPYAADIREAALALADERRFDDAIRKIDTFPQQFRNSGTWTSLQKLRQDIERRKKK
ncbi:MAG TPA: hypothetical protein VE981_21720 [Planctomycetota bacterium]|nr:hypothetical protein [Planctomycetota bacterium]